MKFNDGNEKFFKDLATAYVNWDGERLKKEELPHVSNFATDGLDKKLKARMAVRKKKTVKNWTIAMSTLAAGFLMFIIFSTVIPTYLLHDDFDRVAPAPAAEEPAAPAVAAPDFNDAAGFAGEPIEAPAMVESEEFEEALDEDDYHLFAAEPEMPEEAPEPDFDENDYLLLTLDNERSEVIPEAEDLPSELEDTRREDFVATWVHFIENYELEEGVDLKLPRGLITIVPL